MKKIAAIIFIFAFLFGMVSPVGAQWNVSKGGWEGDTDSVKQSAESQGLNDCDPSGVYTRIENTEGNDKNACLCGNRYKAIFDRNPPANQADYSTSSIYYINSDPYAYGCMPGTWPSPVFNDDLDENGDAAGIISYRRVCCPVGTIYVKEDGDRNDEDNAGCTPIPGLSVDLSKYKERYSSPSDYLADFHSSGTTDDEVNQPEDMGGNLNKFFLDASSKWGKNVTGIFPLVNNERINELVNFLEEESDNDVAMRLDEDSGRRDIPRFLKGTNEEEYSIRRLVDMKLNNKYDKYFFKAVAGRSDDNSDQTDGGKGVFKWEHYNNVDGNIDDPYYISMLGVLDGDGRYTGVQQKEKSGGNDFAKDIHAFNLFFFFETEDSYNWDESTDGSIGTEEDIEKFCGGADPVEPGEGEGVEIDNVIKTLCGEQFSKLIAYSGDNGNIKRVSEQLASIPDSGNLAEKSCNSCIRIVEPKKEGSGALDVNTNLRITPNEDKINEFVSCSICEGKNEDTLWYEGGCVEATAPGVINRVFQIAVGIMGAMVIGRVFQVLYLLNNPSASSDNAAQAREIVISLMVFGVFLGGAIILLRFLGYNILGIEIPIFGKI